MRIIGATIISICLFAVGVMPAYAAVNINTAPSDELQTLHGIGPAYADRIITYRTQNDGFNELEEIQEVSGIGPQTYEGIKSDITLGTTDTEDDTNDDENTNDPDEGEGGTNDETETNDDTDSDDSGGGGESRELEESRLYLSFDHKPNTAVAQSPITFTANGRIDGHASYVAKYTWSFGDGTRSRGEEVTHTYHGPGTYTVVLKAETLEQTRRTTQTVTVHDPDIRIQDAELGTDGSVTLTNPLNKSVDLTAWKLISGGDVFAVPEMTYLAGDSSVTFAASAIELPIHIGGVTLLTPDGASVDHYAFQAESEPTTPNTTRNQTNANPPQTLNPASSGSHSPTPTETDSEQEQEDGASTSAPDNSPATSTLVASVGESSESGTWPWVLGLAGVVGLGMMGVGLRSPAGNAEGADSASQYSIHDISDD